MKIHFVVFLLLVLLLMGCQDTTGFDPAATWRAQLEQTRQAQTPQFTAPAATETAGSPTATATAEPGTTLTVFPTDEPTPTATGLPEPAGINLLQNPSFEGSARFGDGGFVAEGWGRYYCNTPYTPDRCAIPVEWNPYEPYMKTPEYNLADQRGRVDDGKKAQHWFGANSATNSGIYQDVQVVPGEYYLLRYQGQMWIADGNVDGHLDQPCVRRDGTNKCVEWGSDAYHSDRATEDDLNAAWMIAGVGSCSSNAFDGTVLWGRPHGYFDGLYDKYATVTMGFQATSPCVRVYLGGWSRYAKGHNDFFLDATDLRRAEFSAPTPEPTPTRIATPQGN